MKDALRIVAIPLVIVGLLASACTGESRDEIREALPSGVSGLPSVLPSLSLTGGPTGGESVEPTGPTGGKPTGGEPGESSGPTGSVEAPTEELGEPQTETPSAEPTQSPGPGQGRLILAIIGILQRLGERPPPSEQPSPTEAPEPGSEPATGPLGETAMGPTGGATGDTSVVAEPTGATGATGSAEDDASADVVQAAASSTTESPAWVLVVFLATLGGVLWYLWWRGRRGRAHHG